MKKAEVYQQGAFAGVLEELDGGGWRFTYADGYTGQPVSLTMAVAQAVHEFDRFPPALEGLLPEGSQLEAMLRRYKLDRTDLFGQLVVAGQDLVGSLTVKEVG
ncbi:MAG: HipA N-terminal domain-containing protein [Verrucomicrobiota bacterium]